MVLVGHACLKLLAGLNFKRGQWAKAAYYFELFLQRCPDDPRRTQVLYNLGQAHEKMGELELAVQVYSEFINTVPSIDPRIETVNARIEKLVNK